MSKKHDQAWCLRDLARSVALSKGTHGDHDGVRVVTYDGPRLRIHFTPGIAGASNPLALEIWKIGSGVTKVLSCYWNDHGTDCVVTFLPGSWEDALKLLAGVPVLIERAVGAAATPRPVGGLVPAR
jgi:hypothetical protein